MKTIPVGQAGKQLSAIVSSRKATKISVGRFDRAAILPLPDEATSVEYEVVPIGHDYIPGPDDAMWTVRPVA